MSRNRKILIAFSAFAGLNTVDFFDMLPIPKRQKGKIVEVRKEPKIGWNEICTKCSLGVKSKHCCKLKI